jgi:hypothetical protein
VKRLATAPSAAPTEGTGSSRGRIRRTLGALVGSSGLTLALALLLAPAAPAAPWGFEQVTPVNKGSGAISYVDTFRASPDGNTFLYTTNSEFSGIPGEGQPLYMRYISRRGADAWSNRSVDPPYDAGAGSGAAVNIMGVTRTSYGLDYAIMGSTVAKTPGATEGGGNVYLRNTMTGEYTLLATSENRIISQLFTTTYGAASSQWVAPDGRGAIFGAPIALVPGAPENADNSSKGGAAYGWTADGGLEALSVLPASEGGGIAVMSSWGAGTETGPRESTPRHNGLAHFYFGDMKENEFGRDIGGVYERTDGVTYPISYSRVTGDQSALEKSYVLSTSDNGEYMLFVTKEQTPLTSDSPPPDGELGAVSYLYRYKQSDKSIEYVGMIGGYSGAFQMTQDGRTVGFQSTAKLTDDAIVGEPNLYLWRDGELQLIATPEPGSTGASTASGMRVLSENGRYVVFTDNSARLADRFDQENLSEKCPPMFGTGPGPCDQVFLFDAEATGAQLHCVSCRPDGAAPNGISGDPVTNNSSYARMDEHQMQTAANDGTAFFTTKDGLLPQDNNELEDVYAYRDGELRLVSRAAAGMASRFLDATYDGKTVFFATNDPIVGTDTDRAYDVYMTREGAGYPFSPVVPAPPCDGVEACRGGTAAAPVSPSAGSATFSGRGNVKGDSRARRQAVSVARAKAAVGATATLKVTAPGKGTLKLTGAGIKAASRSVAKAATYRLQATLTAAAKRALAKAGVVRKKVKVTFTPSAGKASSVTLQVTYKAAANRKGN